MTEVKYPWVVVLVDDGFAAARNGKDGTPEMGCHYYTEWQDAQQIRIMQQYVDILTTRIVHDTTKEKAKKK